MNVERLLKMNCIDCGKSINKKSTRCIPCRNRMIEKNNEGENNVKWKGQNISYKHIHGWMNKKYGKAFMCQFNPNHIGFFEWANLSGKYIRDRSDWIMSCHSCNIKMDNRKRDEKGRFI